MAKMKRITEKQIMTQDMGSAFALRCPRCGWDFIHQLGAIVFHRGEDAPSVVQTNVLGDNVSMAVVPSDKAQNPSDRRQGLAIQFSCEHCGGGDADNVLELTLAQHKGYTLIAWRFTPLTKP